MNETIPYKVPDIDWIEEIPQHWKTIRLKYISDIKVSNVDKHIFEGEKQVLLCNYTDVYYNEFIDNQVNLKEGSCTSEEYKKFKIRKGDVIITKDSETPDDMGIPSFVKTDLENVVCGYHLCIISPSDGDLDGTYLFRQLQTKLVRNYFEVNSFGITRFGLGKSSIENLEIILPPVLEQNKIGHFLNEKIETIDKLISTKERKIELLKEQRTSIINQVITKGLYPNVRMKDSGIEWIGEIPEHWETIGFTKIIKIRHGFQFREYDFTDEGIKVIKITQLDRDGYLNIDNCSFISKDRIEEFKDIIIREDDVLMCLTGGTIGKIIKVGKVNEPLVQNYRVGHFSPNNTSVLNNYIFWFMSSDVLLSQIFYEIRETGQPNIGIEDFRRMKIILPPVSEQIKVVEQLDTHTNELDEIVLLEQKKIDLLREYKQSLTSEVVTGKIDVRTDIN